MNDVTRLLDHLKIDKAHIVGYSVSAGTGLLLVVHHGERVRTMSCCGAGTVSFGSNTPPAGIPKSELPLIAQRNKSAAIQNKEDFPDRPNIPTESSLAPCAS